MHFKSHLSIDPHRTRGESKGGEFRALGVEK